ncbi:MAG: tRNA (adenosine(37)-N6)-threonylcarbamoyltransferase complex ATPase subunit type 1 TsaE [Lachnospiraceae bacterium]|nr:tRNA (adenosine(37)-N6)-threonylcarbamoyltransferase complex ATPase subunit type 1 TsaE [Lachnoclostridium sp.]MDD7522333.1 tRNA (adenosine(37)-N6)-threonylcarbamoyltransferase complex ATPase subunit type 1 TsaE [Lachnoclostridium sp.]MDY2599141.1 tRNA (adenosine(37)-N6)-threonylcarbamoyltransferase complex ATPase subunit type 1 TsaE [Lachnospiraceae bacterium]
MSKLNLEYESFKAEDTREFAKMLAKEAKEGQIYLLSGDLGTGKTAFAQGFAQGLGIEDYVNSPTFTIMQIYDKGRLPLYHFDVYRIGDSSEMDELGYEEYFFGNGVSLVEWPEMIEDILPDDAIRITIEKDLTKGFDYRLIKVKEGIDV